MSGLGEAERDKNLSVQSSMDEVAFLRVGAEVLYHDYIREIADDRVFVLQIVEKAQPFPGQMFPDHSHPQVTPAAAFELFCPPYSRGRLKRKKPALSARRFACAEEFLPFLAWQAAFLEVGACVFPAVVEEAVVVVLVLERGDLVVDELRRDGRDSLADLGGRSKFMVGA